MHYQVEPLHFSDEGRNVVPGAGLARTRRQGHRQFGMLHHPADRLNQPIRIGLGDHQGVAAIGQHIQQAVGIGRDNGLPHRQRLKHGERRAFPQRGKHHDVEGRERGRDVAGKACEHELVTQAQCLRLRLELRLQLTFADDEDARVGMTGQHLRCGGDQILIAL